MFLMLTAIYHKYQNGTSNHLVVLVCILTYFFEECHIY